MKKLISQDICQWGGTYDSLESDPFIVIKKISENLNQAKSQGFINFRFFDKGGWDDSEVWIIADRLETDVEFAERTQKEVGKAGKEKQRLLKQKEKIEKALQKY